MKAGLPHLPTLLVASGVVAALAAVVGGLLAGSDGALGAALGVLVAAGSFTVSSVVIAWADSVATPLILPFGLMTYIVKLTVIGAVMLLVAASGWAGLIPMCWGIAAGVFTWTTTQVVWVVRRGTSPTSQSQS